MIDEAECDEAKANDNAENAVNGSYVLFHDADGVRGCVSE